MNTNPALNVNRFRIVAFAIVLLFAFVVWPTPYEYFASTRGVLTGSSGGNMHTDIYRVNRITRSVQLWNGKEWTDF